MNPHTHLHNTHPVFFFAYFSFQGNKVISAAGQAETQLKGDSPSDCSHWGNNNSEFHLFQMSSTGHDLFRAVCEHCGTHTYPAHSSLQRTCISRRCGKRNIERASFSFCFITGLFLPHYSPFFPILSCLRCFLISLSSFFPLNDSFSLFPLADLFPHSQAKTLQYDTKTDHTHFFFFTNTHTGLRCMWVST